MNKQIEKEEKYKVYYKLTMTEIKNVNHTIFRKYEIDIYFEMIYDFSFKYECQYSDRGYKYALVNNNILQYINAKVKERIYPSYPKYEIINCENPNLDDDVFDYFLTHC